MKNAILIAGEEYHFGGSVFESSIFSTSKRLKQEFRFDSVSELYCYQYSLFGLLWRLWRLIQYYNRTGAPLLLLYNGHGGETEWAVRKGKDFRYSWVRWLLRLRNGPTLFINDTCQAHAVALDLQRFADPNSLRIISACDVGQESSGFFNDIFRWWCTGKPYQPNNFSVIESETGGYGTKTLISDGDREIVILDPNGSSGFLEKQLVVQMQFWGNQEIERLFFE